MASEKYLFCPVYLWYWWLGVAFCIGVTICNLLDILALKASCPDLRSNKKTYLGPLPGEREVVLVNVIVHRDTDFTATTVL